MSVCRVCQVDKALWDFVEVSYGEPEICIPCSEKAALEREAVRRQPTVQQALRHERVGLSIGRLEAKADRSRFQWELRNALPRLESGRVLEVSFDAPDTPQGVSRSIGTVLDSLNAELAAGAQPFGKAPIRERVGARTLTVAFRVGRGTRRSAE